MAAALHENLVNSAEIAGKANCGCVYHAEDGIPCEHDIELAKNSGTR